MFYTFTQLHKTYIKLIHLFQVVLGLHHSESGKGVGLVNIFWFDKFFLINILLNKKKYLPLLKIKKTLGRSIVILRIN
ncbi:MAG: hypothetical protein EAY79_00400 [Runella slithyformis]|nr:MAG: hypothetical protein EAY79_00400 [Runella slithyformis]